MVIEAAGSGVLLGLSTGLYCLASCAPIMVPLMMGEERTSHTTIRVVAELVVGRFFAYLLVGALAGIFAAELEGELFHRLNGVALILVSLLLLYSIIRMTPWKPGACHCLSPVISKTPVLFGFLTGINICPPFLLAISYAVALGSILGSILLFLGFFLGTTVFLLLLIPVGLSGRYENFRIVGRMTGVFASLLCLVVGVEYLAG